MASKLGKVLLDFWLILTLGSVNIVGFSLAGLMLLLAWLKVNRVLWGLLWIPVYVIVLTIGYRRYRQFKAQQAIHRVAVAWGSYEERYMAVDERTRLDQIREVLNDPSVRKALKFRFSLQDRERIDQSVQALDAGTISDYLRAVMNWNVWHLSYQVSVEVVRPGAEWRICDQEAEKVFTIKLENGTLNIYLKGDLNNLGRIRNREEWRLGVILPGHDSVGRLGFLNPSKRAVIFPKSVIGHLADIAVSGSTSFYSRRIRLPSLEGCGEEQYSLQEINVLDPSHRYQPILLPQFLQEEDFPIEQSKLSRQFATTVSGVIVPTPDPKSGGKYKYRFLHPRFFIQRVLIDDEGEAIWLGLDYGQDPTPKFSVWMHPTLDVLTKLLTKVYQEVEGAPWHYEPLVWYHTPLLPFADAELPLLDIPPLGHTLVEVIVEPEGRSRILIPRQGADLRALIKHIEEHWERTLSDCGGHLLHLTKDKDKLRKYLDRKMEILNEYYLCEDYKFNLEENGEEVQKQGLKRTMVSPRLGPLTQAVSLAQRIAERANRLGELHPKDPGMKRAIRRGWLIGGLLSLPLAFYWGKSLLAVAFLAGLGALIGEMNVRTYRMSVRRFWDGLAISQRWAFLFGLIIAGVDYLIFRDLGRVWVSGLIGFLWGHHRGFIRWWNREAHILRRQLFEKIPIENFSLYSNHEYDFSIRYPPGWTAVQIQGLEGAKKVAFFSPDRGVYINVVVGRREGPDPIPEEYLPEIERLLKAALGPKDDLVNPPCRIRLGGVKPRSGVWEVVYVKAPILLQGYRKIKKIALVRQGVEYFFTYGAPPNKFDWYEEAFDRCMQSLGFHQR